MLTKWYRIGFRDTTPFLDTAVEIGTNTENRVKTYFLAPLDEKGETLMDCVRSIAADERGNPTGYSDSVEGAQEFVHAQLQGQIDRISQARDEIQALIDARGAEDASPTD